MATSRHPAPWRICRATVSVHKDGMPFASHAGGGRAAAARARTSGATSTPREANPPRRKASPTAGSSAWAVVSARS
eukprot:4302878-Alexandrium_andersonii.AAC.1